MRIDKKLIAGILSELPTDANLTDYLTDSLLKVQETEAQLDKLRSELQQEEDKYKANVRQIQREINEAQHSCRHWSLSHHGDGVTSARIAQCDLCGMQL